MEIIGDLKIYNKNNNHEINFSNFTRGECKLKHIRCCHENHDLKQTRLPQYKEHFEKNLPYTHTDDLNDDEYGFDFCGFEFYDDEGRMICNRREFYISK